MMIHRVEQCYNNTLPQQPKKIHNPQRVYIANFPQNSRGDEFLSSAPQKQISFEGIPFIEKLMQDYLRTKTYKTSIKGSKRPYLSIDPDLAPIVKEVKISVSPFEQINAWDINPKNSKDYILFLHGFSQNITSNQPLYKELAKSKFGILSIDYRAYGKNPPSPHVSEDDIALDVKSAMNYLKARGVNSIGIVGHSFGAYIGAKVSKQIPPEFLVMVSPMHSLEFWLKNVIKHPAKYKFEIKLVKYLKGFNEQYKKVFNISEHLKDNKTAMYVVQAYNDKYVRTSKVNELVKQIPNIKQYTRICGGGHRMDESKIKEIRRILDNL